MSEADVEAHNLREAWRVIMGRLSSVEDELQLIGGELDDVRVYTSVEPAIEAALRTAEQAVESLRARLLAAGAR